MVLRKVDANQPSKEQSKQKMDFTIPTYTVPDVSSMTDFSAFTPLIQHLDDSARTRTNERVKWKCIPLGTVIRTWSGSIIRQQQCNSACKLSWTYCRRGKTFNGSTSGSICTIQWSNTKCM